MENEQLEKDDIFSEEDIAIDQYNRDLVDEELEHKIGKCNIEFERDL